MKPASRAATASAMLTATALAVLTGPGAVAAHAVTPTRTTTVSFKLAYSSAAGFYLRASGTASGTVGRKVYFQRWTGKTWTTIASGKTDKYHRYQLNTVSTLAGSFKLHVYVPASGSYKSRTSATATATTHRNATAATLRVPSGVTWGGTATVTFSGSTTEARRNVYLQQYSGGAWKNVTWKTVTSTAVKGSTVRRLNTTFSFTAPSWGSTPLRAVVTTTALSNGAYSASGTTTVQLAAPKVYTGQAFDACTAPSLDAMAAMKAANTYGAVGVYIGKAASSPTANDGNRSCAQPNLTKSWVASVHATGFGIIPIYIGAQSPNNARTDIEKIPADLTKAAALGTTEGLNAVSSAAALGIKPGSPIYLDMENWEGTSASGTNAVLAYTRAWDLAVHQHGYWAGFYGNATKSAVSNQGLYEVVTATGANLPDIYWYAQNDGQSTTTNLSYLPATWTAHRIAHQYALDVSDSTLGANVDKSAWDAPVAVVG